MDPIGAINGAISGVKNMLALRDIQKNAVAKLAVAELQVQLADVKVLVAGLVEENQRLRDELKKATNTVPVMIPRDGKYYNQDGDGPFCTTCYDNTKKQIRLQELPLKMYRNFGKWKCGVCKTFYKAKGSSES